MLLLFQDKDKVSLTKTPKLDRSDGGKEVREQRARELPFTAGANASETRTQVPPPTLAAWAQLTARALLEGLGGVLGETLY